MGKISDRIMGSVDEFAGRFGNRLATWGMSLVARGATKTNLRRGCRFMPLRASARKTITGAWIINTV